MERKEYALSPLVIIVSHFPLTIVPYTKNSAVYRATLVMAYARNQSACFPISFSSRIAIKYKKGSQTIATLSQRTTLRRSDYMPAYFFSLFPSFLAVLALFAGTNPFFFNLDLSAAFFIKQYNDGATHKDE